MNLEITIFDMSPINKTLIKSTFSCYLNFDDIQLTFRGLAIFQEGDDKLGVWLPTVYDSNGHIISNYYDFPNDLFDAIANQAISHYKKGPSRIDDMDGVPF